MVKKNTTYTPDTCCPECHQHMEEASNDFGRWAECCNPDCVACDVPEPPGVPTVQACTLCPEVKTLMRHCRVFLDRLTTLYEGGNPTIKQAVAMERALRKLERAGTARKPPSK